MAITIGWEDMEGRKWTEYLDIDTDHLDPDAIEQLEETKQCWPDKGEFLCWRVECTLKERDNGDREITVKYTQSQQDDENVRMYLKNWGPESCFGENRIIVTRDPKTGQWATEGDYDWKCKDVKWSGPGRWQAHGPTEITSYPRTMEKRKSIQRESFGQGQEVCNQRREDIGSAGCSASSAVKEGGEELVRERFHFEDGYPSALRSWHVLYQPEGWDDHDQQQEFVERL